MRSASRNRSLLLGGAVLAFGACAAPPRIPAHDGRAAQDSSVASSRNGLRLGDKTIRVFLGRASGSDVIVRSGPGITTWNGRRYRGTVDVLRDVSGDAVVNALDLEDYLRGVLPGEIGSRDPRDRAALQAQAVAARSYAAARMGERRTLFDVTATVTDQVYGGMSVERAETDDAVRVTRGLVLTWADRIITAPYHAHGGLMTASADEAFWRNASPTYLRPVDDHAPGGGCYCDASGSRGWERRFTTAGLREQLQQYGAAAGVAGVSAVRMLRITARGPSGRVTALEFEMADGRAIVRGNDIRSVLRTDGAILPSTNFSVEMLGDIVLLRGVGNGHGVGMSQWGAIGRARAGHDARSILAAYYPGTRLAPLL